MQSKWLAYCKPSNTCLAYCLARSSRYPQDGFKLGSPICVPNKWRGQQQLSPRATSNTWLGATSMHVNSDLLILCCCCYLFHNIIRAKLLYPFHFHKSVKKPEPIPNSTSKIPDCHTYCFLREAWLK